ncbi:protein SCO1 homolog, mitochondrial [Planococcus citri]|uniref:protein SCO1 homolog, mitochondrial n=1 Tax=Planococcus citri TaxID=170843 RepID=UPI0031F970C0
MTGLLSKLCRTTAIARFVKPSTVCQSHVLRSLENKRFASSFKRSSNKPAITWKNLLVVSGFGGALLFWMKMIKDEKDRKDNIERKRQLGKAAIGGPFELVDQDKNLRKSEDFKGQWLLVYFGFTHCPDICPDEIEKMVKTVDIIDSNPVVPNIQPIFITVDPDRDTPEVVGKYIKEFSPKFIGLTGNREQIDKVCKAYRVYYSSGPADEDNDYIVDHTIIIYLINPDGEFVDYYGQNREALEVAQGIELQMVKYKKMNESATSKLKNAFRGGNANVQGS